MPSPARSGSSPAVGRRPPVLPALAVLALALCLASAAARAQGPPCRPCGGLVTAAPEAVAAAVDELGRFDERAPLYVAFPVDLSPAGVGETVRPAPVDGAVAATRALRAAEATPWARLLFTTAGPLAEAGERLELELEAAAALARASAPDTHFQVIWQPDGGTPAYGSGDAARELAYLLKRASVALTGARPGATVLAGPLPADPVVLQAFYGEDVAAYLDGLALAPAPETALDAAVALVRELDPGRPVVLDAAPLPTPPALALAEAARLATAGVAVAFFDATGLSSATALAPEEEEHEGRAPIESEIRRDPPTVAAPELATPDRGPGADPLREAVAPFVVLAREFAGDLSYDAGSGPFGPDGERAGWSFVRGEDLGVRAIVRRPASGSADRPAEVSFPDPTLSGPETVDLSTGEPSTVFGIGRNAEGLAVPLYGGEPVTLVRLSRGAAGDSETVEEEVTVAGAREIPVEEILRRLQAFEDAQARKLDRFSAMNTTHLRFGAGAGIQGVETTLEGPFFFRQGEGYDWAWTRFYVNGVRWRSPTIPEIPLIQPEKAAVLPIEITFTRQYDYRLVGSEEIDGRDAWVVEFRPAVSPEDANLYRGRVWIDKEHYARLRSRAVQLGLEGEVLSNEETLFYTAVDASGAPVSWERAPEAGTYVLPLRLVGQQILSVVNATTVVEREVLLSEIEVNAADFEERREAVLASDATMVRDTEQGLRYLVKEEGVPGRVVQEGFDTGRLFAIGGVFYDDSLEYPVPLAGVNYLNFDVRGTGRQMNLFFGGALLVADFADPRLFGTRFDAGVDLFALAVPLGDSLYRNGEEVPGEEVEVRPANVSFKLGRPLGNFVKLRTEYELAWSDYGVTDETAPGFRVPSDHFLHSFELGGTFTRSGYRLGLAGSYNLRSEWEPWGFADDVRDVEAEEDYLLWEASFAKSWYLPSFQKIGAEIAYAGGEDLDRFSKVSFGFFGGTRVHGYQSNRVRAEEAWAAHLSYGFEIGQAFRLEAVADAAWATDEETGLDDELLAGVGLVGTFLGPWETVVNLDVGVPLEGPDDGVVVYVVFLKLFEWDRFERWFE